MWGRDTPPIPLLRPFEASGSRLSGICDRASGMPRPLGSGQWIGLLSRDGSDEEGMSPQRALDHLDELSHILSAERVGLFSDFDGTLTPIFDDPRDTVLDSKIRDLLAVLAEKLDLVAVVSGRGVGFLRGWWGWEGLPTWGIMGWRCGGR